MLQPSGPDGLVKIRRFSAEGGMRDVVEPRRQFAPEKGFRGQTGDSFEFANEMRLVEITCRSGN